ncbi:hypothetical protein K1719_045113 [Acacia pycnantha]|nr:hypothetical protein K1719_045113 [Acacia pycnantha]
MSRLKCPSTRNYPNFLFLLNHGIFFNNGIFFNHDIFLEGKNHSHHYHYHGFPYCLVNDDDILWRHNHFRGRPGRCCWLISICHIPVSYKI